MKTQKMRVSLFLAVVAITTMISMVLVVFPASAETTRVDFVNYNIACTVASSNMWISEDGVVHLRDHNLNSVVISTTPYMDGPGHIYGNANITDPVTGVGTYFGTLDIYPTAYPDGYWEGNWNFQIKEDGAQGIARLKGYGSLEGMLSFSALLPLPPDVLAAFAPYCGGSQPVAGTYVVGYYMIPGGE